MYSVLVPQRTEEARGGFVRLRCEQDWGQCKSPAKAQVRGVVHGAGEGIAQLGRGDSTGSRTVVGD